MSYMTIAHALKELKFIDQKIQKRTSLMATYSAGQSNQVPTYGEKQREKVQQLQQSISDLIQRKMDLKLKIANANVDTIVKFRNKSYSLQEILFMKNAGKGKSISNLKKEMFAALHTDTRIESMVYTLNNTKNDKEAIPIKVITYFDVEARDKEEEEFNTLLGELDYLIDQANFSTPLTIEPWNDDDLTK
jgi:hypothetical protein